jgi:putative ABC transport system permease protein
VWINSVLAFALLRRHLGLMVSFVVLFSLGLGIYATTQSLSSQVNQDLKSKNKEIIEGDVRITLRRDLSIPEKELIRKVLGPSQSETWSFFSMVGFHQKSKLIQIKALQNSYPLLPLSFLSSQNDTLPSVKPGQIYIPEDLAQHEKINIDDVITLGRGRFVVKGIYNRSPDSYLDFSRMMHRAYIHFDDLEATQLAQKGSRIFKSHHYVLNYPLRANFHEKLKALDDPEIKIEHSGQENSDFSSRIDMVMSFLRLITLLTFLLTALGGIQFFKSHLQRESENQGILFSLGATPFRMAAIYFLQLFFLAILALFGSYLLAKMFYSVFSPILMEQFSFVLDDFVFPWFSLSITLLLTLFFGLGQSVYAIAMASNYSLLRSQVAHPPKLVSFLFDSLVFPLWCFALAYFQSQSIVLSISFVALFYLALWGSLPFLLCFWLWIKRASLFFWKIQFFIFQIKNQGSRGVFAFSTLVFIVLILNLLPQIQHILETELRPSKAKELPRWFLIDLQEEDLNSLDEKLKPLGASIDKASPMIRARLESINGVAFQALRQEQDNQEDKQKQRWRNRGYNLSYRDSLSEHEQIIEGGTWTKSWDGSGLPGLSIEKRFAQRIGISLGDTLNFLIEGINIPGKVINFRKVRWASFSPNFFVLFQPGVLEDAPKTFILSLPEFATPAVTTQFRNILQETFPMVSLIDLRDIVNKTLTEFNRWVLVMQALCLLALVCGVFIFMMVIAGLIRDSIKEWLLLEALGYTPKNLFALMGLNQLLFLGTAALLGLSFSALASWGINKLLWSLPWAFQWQSVWQTAIFVLILATGSTLFGAKLLFKGKLQSLLRSS